MRSAKLTMNKYLPVLFVACGLQLVANAQENSPYSRYGLGDLTPNHNILSRGMGGIAAGVFDYQSINFTNPATLGGISSTIFDIGLEADVRTLKTATPPQKSTSANALFSYLQLGFPVSTKKMKQNGVNWGMSFGLRPVSRIDYDIEKDERLPGIDSLQTLYQGSGGLNQVFFGTGFQIKEGTGNKIENLNFGLNFGYVFGTKNYSTRLIFMNDTVDYYRSNSADSSHFGGLFVNGGFQYQTSFKTGILTIGIYGNIQERLNAKRNVTRETFSYDANGTPYRVDSIYDQNDIKGTIVLPGTIGIGFSYQDKHWLYGADYEFTNWANYTYYRQTDDVQNSWVVRAGAQYFPANEKTHSDKYWSFVRYRLGAYYGPDYVKVNNSRPNYGFTVGTGMPLTSLRRLSYNGEYVVLNTALEIGGRGDKSTSLRESTVKFSVGISMNANWFQKRKYD
jgi:hypothetical protein